MKKVVPSLHREGLRGCWARHSTGKEISRVEAAVQRRTTTARRRGRRTTNGEPGRRDQAGVWGGKPKEEEGGELPREKVAVLKGERESILVVAERGLRGQSESVGTERTDVSDERLRRSTPDH